jgi:hypothetical protein
MAEDSKQRNEQLSRLSQASIEIDSGNNRLSITSVQMLVMQVNTGEQQLHAPWGAGTVRQLPSLL